MNTPAHLILGLAVFGKPVQSRVTLAAGFGALAPDLSLYVLVTGALISGYSAEQIFGTLYFSDAWQAVFRIDNSAPIWCAFLGLAAWRRWDWGVAMAGAALLHIACDLPLHHDDGRAHFWPLTTWIYESPFSYWDSAHGATWIAPAETLLAVSAAGWAAWILPGWQVRLVLATAVVCQLAVGGVWAVLF